MLHNTITGGYLGIQKLQAMVKIVSIGLGGLGMCKNGAGSVMIVYLVRIVEKLLVSPFRCLGCPTHMSG